MDINFATMPLKHYPSSGQLKYFCLFNLLLVSECPSGRHKSQSWRWGRKRPLSNCPYQTGKEIAWVLRVGRTIISSHLNQIGKLKKWNKGYNMIWFKPEEMWFELIFTRQPKISINETSDCLHTDLNISPTRWIKLIPSTYF